MAIEVNGTTVSLHTQTYSNNRAKLLEVSTQKALVHHFVWDIAAIQALQLMNN